MKATRCGLLVTVAVALLFVGVFHVRAQKKENAGTTAKSTMMRTPIGGPTQVHLFPAQCRSQEPMVHADKASDHPPGKVIFFSPTDVVLTMNRTGILKEDDPVHGTIKVSGGHPTPVDVLASPPDDNPVITQYKIGSCAPPWSKKDDKKKTRSDPNDIIVP
jgi:hypothetical protein